MTELDYHKLFIDWLGEKGIVNESHIAQFDRDLRLKKEAEQFVKEMLGEL